MSDPAEDIAAAVADYLGDEARAYSRTVVASVPDQPSTELKAEHTGVRAVVIPVGEVEEKESRSRVMLAPSVNVVITANCEAAGERTELAALVREIRQSLRFVAMGGWVWQRSETLTKYDPDQLGKERFLAAFGLTYLGME